MYQNNISFLYFILIRLFAQKKRNYAVNNKMKNPVCHFDDFFSFAIFYLKTEKRTLPKTTFRKCSLWI